MTDSYFPADVSVRFEGATDPSQKLLAKARNLLFKALEVQRNGNKNIVRLFAPAPDGSLVQVFLSGNLKQLYIRPAPEPPPPEVPPEVEQPEEPVKVYINTMLSGVVKAVPPAETAQLVQVDNPNGDDPATVPAVDEFHPDEVTAGAYALDFNWQRPPQLGVADDGSDAGTATSNYPKPCMYSGSMKRVVSAVLGVGRQDTETLEYISGELPLTYPQVVAWNQYDYTWPRTHGIIKADDGSVWLCEISQDNGVMVMPLPIFDGTDEQGYLDWLYSFGDSDTIAIVLEFGGLPTGEPFPTGATLDAAIADGKVVRFLSAADVADFYYDADNSRDKLPYFLSCGWAFSDSGKKAVNTCCWFSRPDIVGPPATPVGYPYTLWVLNGDSSTRYFDQVITADGHRFDDRRDRYLRTEMWQIQIAVARNTDPESTAVAIGGASITRLEENIIAHGRDHSAFSQLSSGLEVEDGFAYTWTLPPWWFPNGADEEFLDSLSLRPFGRSTGDSAADQADWAAAQGAPVYAFYVGEELEVVRYYPFYGSDGIGLFRAPGYFNGDSLALAAQSYTTDPYDDSAAFDIGLVVPAFTREAYALLKFTYPSVLGGDDGDVETHLFIGDSMLTLGPDDLSPSAIPDGGEATFPHLTWLYGWLGYHPLDNDQLQFGASINTGPMVAYVVSDGVLRRGDTQHYVNSDTLDPYGLPADTPAKGVTFVGSVSTDG